MDRKLLLFVFFSMIFMVAFGGERRDSSNFFKAFQLSNHPFGLFIARINHNFDLQASTKQKLSFTFSRGNVWLPYAKGKFALSQGDRDFLSQYAWHDRNYQAEAAGIVNFSERELDADGIFTTYFFNFTQPLAKSSDVSINLKFGSLSGGKVPYSLLTSDQFIEWFHSNVIGGEDPFGRKSRPYNLANFNYRDRSGKELIVKNGDFLFSEVSADWNFHAPSILPGFKTVYALHTGTSKLKKSYLLNTGLALTQLKRFFFKQDFMDLGVAGSVMFPGTFMRLPVEINNRKFLASFELNAVYAFQLKKNQLGLGVNYHLQSPFHRPSETNYYIVESEGISSHGHYAISHLNRPLQGWSFSITYATKSISITAFMREDALVDNAPDAQVGWAVQVKL